MKYKRGTMLKQGKTTGFVCDDNNGGIYPISVIWDNIEGKVFTYNEEWLNNEFNGVEIINRDEYIRLLENKWWINNDLGSIINNYDVF